MMDRVDEWRMFVAVASLRSFVLAARSLGRSPQSVTRAVAALEGRIGTRLLNRTTRSVSLSNDGERYLERTRRLLAEFDALESAPTDRAQLGGLLAVTASVLFGQQHVAPVVAEFLDQEPATSVRLMLVDRVVSLAEEGIDVGVRVAELPDSSLRARWIGQVRSVVCASPGYLRRAGTPRAPEAIAKHACIAFTATTPIPERWSFPRAGQRASSVSARPRLIVNTGQAAIDAAVAGLGLVRVLSYQVDRLVAEKKLRIVLADYEPKPVPVHIVHLPGVQARVAESFIAFASERLRARLAGGSPA